MNPVHYRELLQRELQRRISVNTNYSMRAFARALKMDPADLCRVLSGKVPLSLRTGLRVSQELSLNSEDAKQFIDSIVDEQRNRVLTSLNRSMQ